MAQYLPNDLELAQQSMFRNPCAKVIVTDPYGIKKDITADVISFNIEMTEYNEANKAKLVVSNLKGKYDKLNRDSADRFTLKEDNLITIQKGFDEVYVPAGVFKIRKAEPSKYERGGEETLTINCFDLVKNLLKTKLTTDLYKRIQANNLVTDILTKYGGIEKNKIKLDPSLNYEIKQVQFIDEKIWDAVVMVMQSQLYNIYFDEEGNVRSSPMNQDKKVSYIYDNAKFAKWFKPKWDDDKVVNSVKIFGRDIAQPELVPSKKEELLSTVEDIRIEPDAAPKNPTTTKDRKVYYFEDKVSKAIDIRLEYQSLKEPMDTNDKAWLHKVYDAYCIVRFKNKNHVTTDADFYYTRVYGKPLRLASPAVLGAEAIDQELINKYGEIEKKIDNPLIQTVEQAQFLADRTLDLAKWSRNKLDLQVIGNLKHQVSDIIQAYHPVYDRILKLYIYSLKHSYKRDNHDLTNLYCYLIDEDI